MKEQKTNQAAFTEIVFIIDRSGSMAGLEEDTIGGFNSLIEKQKHEPGKALVSAVMFEDDCDVVLDRVPLNKVRPLTRRDYTPGGCTALLDAVGGAIHHIGNLHKYADEKDRPDKTLVVIITDGMENASRRYDFRRVRHMIERQQKRYRWEFLFLGANMDAVATAASYGIDAHHSVTYQNDRIGTNMNYEAVCAAVTHVRSAKMAAPLGDGWKRDIEARNRGKRRK